MRTKWRGMAIAVVLLAGLLSGGLQPADANAVTLRLQPGNLVGEVGTTVGVMVQVEGAADLGAFEFHLGYDPAVLEATEVWLGDFLTRTGRTPVPLGPRLDVGEVRFAGASYGTATGPGGSGVLAQITFRVVGSGTTALTFNRVIVTDTDARVLDAGAIDGSFTSGQSPYLPVFVPLLLR